MKLHKTTGTIVLLLFLQFTFTGCNDEAEICSAAQEEEVITYMSGLLDNCTCEISVIRGTFLSNTVYYFGNTSPNCLSVFDPVLYDCKANSFTPYIITDYESFQKFVKFDEVLYRCND